ncbi:unnamed protein product, partial [Rotaria magnacalcarata]
PNLKSIDGIGYELRLNKTNISEDAALRTFLPTPIGKRF